MPRFKKLPRNCKQCNISFLPLIKSGRKQLFCNKICQNKWHNSLPKNKLNRLQYDRRPEVIETKRIAFHILRKLIVSNLGGICACCGENQYEFLAIDHIHNNGNIERAKGLNGAKFLRKIRDLNYPKDQYQILCHNCNFGKRVYGKCPHKIADMNVNVA